MPDKNFMSTLDKDKPFFSREENFEEKEKKNQEIQGLNTRIEELQTEKERLREDAADADQDNNTEIYNKVYDRTLLIDDEIEQLKKRLAEIL